MYELLILLNLALTTVSVICLVYITHTIRALHNVSPSPEYVKETSSTLGEALTINELVTMREVSFDERIAGIKEELARKITTERVSEGDAVTLHPDVVNLPHNIIDYKSRGENTGVEYAD